MASKRKRKYTRICVKKRSGAVLALPAIIIAVIAVKWWPASILAEKDNPEVVVNLITMVGKQGPSFTLADSEGDQYTITTGDGRKYA